MVLLVGVNFWVWANCRDVKNKITGACKNRFIGGGPGYQLDNTRVHLFVNSFSQTH